MIIGEYKTKVGEKKRIAIPKKFRNELGENLILTRGYEKCLVLVSETQWKGIASEVINGSFINRDIRDTSRFLVGSANEVIPDSQGRIVIPQPLYDHANFTDEVIFLGLVNWIEIWSKEEWEKRLEYLETNGDQIAQELSKLSGKTQ
ncbi:MAG: Protein MraZ [candidate division WS6 bacterium GW2011_GWF2_39_15]|uniref:Transcriptional regulator MraZ n=1 Tax=candidate division WS6 bacterium GW2011_GWF2_39_15 TaxID=1619100 RepID=A0A0G0MQ66_9BACT|nr:MAG: Protein MraZ [candidate division WS6 bacterium GW2011_GWF2_39_15]